MDQQEYIDELIIKCLSGEAGVDESKELSRWMDADKEHLAYFLKMKNIWDILLLILKAFNLSTGWNNS